MSDARVFGQLGRGVADRPCGLDRGCARPAARTRCGFGSRSQSFLVEQRMASRRRRRAPETSPRRVPPRPSQSQALPPARPPSQPVRPPVAAAPVTQRGRAAGAAGGTPITVGRTTTSNADPQRYGVPQRHPGGQQPVEPSQVKPAADRDPGLQRLAVRRLRPRRFPAVARPDARPSSAWWRSKGRR